MHRRILGVALAAAGLALACSDNAGPALDTSDTESVAVQSHAFHPLSWKPMDAPPQFTATVETGDGEVLLDPDDRVLASPSAGPPLLSSYEVGFWAVKGQTRSIRINWLDVSRSGEFLSITSQPYLSFSVPPEGLSQGPDGRVYAYGDSVRITVTIDTSAMIAHFEPSGLTFDGAHPAQLQYWYTAAGGDFDGNGLVDKEDAHIEASLLDLWTTQSTGWIPLKAEQSLSEDWLRAHVEHFSGFAVAY